jgi:hypothetical protein
MAKRTKVTETWNGKETFLAKKERDVKGRFIKSKPKSGASHRGAWGYDVDSEEFVRKLRKSRKIEPT